MNRKPSDCFQKTSSPPTKNQKISGGSSASKKRNRDPATRASKPQDVFILVNKNGMAVSGPSTNKVMGFRLYYAQKPCLAATKAYYAGIRFQSSIDASKKLPMFINDVDLKSLENYLFKIGLVKNEISRYLNLITQATFVNPMIVRLRRPDSGKIRSYIVQYEVILRPNFHEIEKGIVKVAKASLLKKSASHISVMELSDIYKIN